ncbi:nitroreductase family protein [Isobaculum melis]|uniref:Nitroreductase n=1 Tax=Isobaculum melis TaxID=142588 RepID=A0A1H9R3N7_9LACT|nr:nitroreductase family protein [Isobaculum melis]SER67354.1 Nitroreductase [Isobaculum melis]
MQQSISEAIVKRRTSKTSLDTPISFEEIQALLEKASYAPFHGKSEPWLAKIVTTSKEKEWLFEQVMACYERNQLLIDHETKERLTKKMTRLILQAPATILFSCETCPDNKRKHYDAIEATSALIQNFSLLAWEKEIVGFWVTSPFILDAPLAKKLGFPENYELIANYRLGYRDFDQPLKEATRQPVDNWASALLS